MDTRLDENEAELAVLVLAVALEVLANGDSLGKMVSNRALAFREMGFQRTFLINM